MKKTEFSLLIISRGSVSYLESVILLSTDDDLPKWPILKVSSFIMLLRLANRS